MPRRDLLGLFPPKVFETNQGSERFKNIEGCPKILIITHIDTSYICFLFLLLLLSFSFSILTFNCSLRRDRAQGHETATAETRGRTHVPRLP